MKLVPVDLVKVERAAKYTRGYIVKIIEEFLESGYECVRVEDDRPTDTYRTQHGLYKSLKNCVRIQGYPVQVRLVGGVPHLIRLFRDSIEYVERK